MNGPTAVITRYFTQREYTVGDNNVHVYMGGAPIGAGGHDPLLLEAKGTGRT